MAKVTIDTNLLVYAIDSTDLNKHRTVHTLPDTLVELDTVVSVQALAEFFHVVTRKGAYPWKRRATGSRTGRHPFR
jgi:predicted nucleic acid-binding protein